MALFIGLMSGTSLDGVDGVLVDLHEGTSSQPMQVRAHAHASFAASLRSELLGLNRSGPDELHRAALAANQIATAYAAIVERLLASADVNPSQVRAIGAHGQTVRHRPGEFDGQGYTLQLLNGALLAEKTGIDVVCDFRSRDVAAGGQGAPLVPAFHAECFSQPGRDVAVLNIGGIANLTLLPACGTARGFDCGPGNALMDAWCLQYTGAPFDDDGRWAAAGSVSAPLLATLLDDPFFGRLPPKSTGRDLFNAEWLQSRLALHSGLAPVDVMTTLTALTAHAAAAHIERHQPGTTSLLVCGGGAFNRHLMGLLAALEPEIRVQNTASAGLLPDHVESLAFAWLARAFLNRAAGNLPAVTGAQGLRVLGALYPAAVSG